MSRASLKVVFAYLSEADFRRIRQYARDDKLTMSAFIRAAINDYVEQIGEPSLTDLPPPGRSSHAEDR